MCLPGALCCAGQAACCAGQMCCSCLCGLCAKAGVPSKNFSKLGYVFFQLSWMVIAIVMLLAKGLVDYFPSSLQCPTEAGGGSFCFGPSAIVRISFALAVFHVVIFFIILFRSTMAAIVHDGCWGVKYLLVLAMFIGSLWIPNDFF